MYLPLEHLKRGQSGTVSDVSGDCHWVCRLAELGLRRGARVTVLQCGTPMLLQIGTGRLSLRLDDLAQILVEPDEFLGTPVAEVA